MSAHVTVVDYGLGNVWSVTRAFEHCGATVDLTDSADKIKNAERLVLPGVGAFADGMKGLESRGLTGILKDYAKSGRPLLGICLGMQMMFHSSEEFGENAGLGILPGKVIAIPSKGADGESHKIPHIGWNRLLPPAGKNWDKTLFEGVPKESFVYFVHSFTAWPDEKDRLADADYDGCRISAAVQRGKICATQFHPEKSAEIGLHIVRNFCKL